MERKHYSCFFFLLLCIGWSLRGNAQTALERQVTAAGGGAGQSGDLFIQYTVGEPVIATIGAGDLLLTQGMQQPFLPTVGPYVMPIANFILYPNPASTTVKAQFDLLTEADVQCRIANSIGQQVYQQSQHYGAGQVIMPLPVNRFAKGTYVVILHVKGKVFARKLLVQ
jgi:hypothetical protein